MKVLKGMNTEFHIKPKKVLSPYIAYVKKQRPILTRDCPTMSFGEVMKYLGDRWKEMSDEEKRPYKEQSERDQKRYDYEMR